MSQPSSTTPRPEPLPSESIAPALAELARQVSRLHAVGQIHRAIDGSSVMVQEASVVQLSDPPEVHRLGGDDDSQVCPPEMQRGEPWMLPREESQIRSLLTRAGVSIAPVQIDLYQLGSLVCSWSDAPDVAAYLRSPKARGRVSSSLWSIVDRLLGYNGASRFTSCGELLEALESPPSNGADPSPEAEDRNEEALLPTSTRRRDPKALPFERLGPYRILERIGGGGMGEVYRAYEESLDRDVAVKVLPPELARHEDFVRRFRAEATAVARLTHPNIAQVYSIGSDDGYHFFAMQYVRGESLAQRLARVRRLSPDDTIAILKQSLAGLAEAHRQGLIHRDIKPANILLDRSSGRALVADFGLVKAVEAQTSLTATGVVMGTVDYISPEQARGKVVDGRSDLYSVGVMAYQMLSGRLPFVSETPTGMIFQHAYEPPHPLLDAAPQTPPILAAVVMRLLEKDSTQRYDSAEAVIAELSLVNRRDHSTVAAADESATAPWTVATPSSEENSWRTRLRHWLVRQSPALAARFQNTTQQVDDAVAEYERRHAELTRLLADADSVSSDLRAQVAEHRAMAVEARRAANKDDDQAEALRQSADELARRLAENDELVESLRMQLTRARATLQQLRSQRDVLLARLQVARGSLGQSTRRVFDMFGWKVYAVVAVVLVLVMALLSLMYASKESESVTSRSTETVAARPTMPSVPSRPSSIDNLVMPQGLLAFDSSEAAGLLPGVVIAQYPRVPRVQDASGGAFVPLAELGRSLTAMIATSLSPWEFPAETNAVARGYLKIDVAGEYAFESTNFYDRNALWIGDRLVCGYRDEKTHIGRVRLEPGYIPITSAGYVDGRGKVDVRWQPPGQAQMSAIPDQQLFHLQADAQAINAPAPPKPRGLALIGRTRMAGRDLGLVFEYELGKPLPHTLIEAEVFKHGGSMEQLRIELNGVMHIPADTQITVLLMGGSSSGGVVRLYIDDHEITSVGDDRPKQRVLDYPIEAGDHPVQLVMTGGAMGNTALDFRDVTSGEPVSVTVSDAIMQTLDLQPTTTRITNFDLAPAKLLPEPKR